MTVILLFKQIDKEFAVKSNNYQDENLKLRIPHELQSTIDEVLEKIAKHQLLYSSDKSTF